MQSDNYHHSFPQWSYWAGSFKETEHKSTTIKAYKRTEDCQEQFYQEY